MKVKFLRDKGFCKAGKIVELPDEQAALLIKEEAAIEYKPAKPTKKATAKPTGDK